MFTQGVSEMNMEAVDVGPTPKEFGDPHDPHFGFAWFQAFWGEDTELGDSFEGRVCDSSIFMWGVGASVSAPAAVVMWDHRWGSGMGEHSGRQIWFCSPKLTCPQPSLSQ